MQKLTNLIIYIILSAAFLTSAFLISSLRGLSFWCFVLTIEGGITLMFLLSLLGDFGHFPVSIRYAMVLPPVLLMLIEFVLFLKLGLWAELFPKIYVALHIIIWAALIVAELVLGKSGSYISGQDRADAMRRAGMGEGPQRHGTKTVITRHNVKETEEPNHGSRHSL